MKLNFFTLIAFALIVSACSKEEAIDVPQEQQPLTITLENGPQNEFNGTNATRSSDGPWGPFNCDPSWTPDYEQPFGLQVYQIQYSNDPAHYPGGVVDIDCTRQEYFRNICGLSMKAGGQPLDPYKDIWVRDMSGCDPSTKDDVNTASNNDDRVCSGPNCD